MATESVKRPAPHEQRPPILEPGHTYASVSDKISSIVLTRGIGRGWIVGFTISFLLTMLLLVAISYAVAVGVGIWGINIPVGWGFAIINFVWWIGIGHAGTLISAILLLLRQEWRTSINRFAEAMTLFAVANAGIFPLLHVGRQWLAYWLLPYPNTMDLYPQWRSPLVFDVFAISTYATVSLMFWYIGLVPDLATLRDRARNRLSRMIYGIFAMGWRGSAAHWRRYEVAYLLMAGLATPLVVSVHTIVSFDFAISVIPGWHTTVFPPYFVAGAIYAGFAMVLVLTIPIRKIYGLEDFITMRHLDLMARVMLTTGLIVGYGYLMEAFFAYYSANEFEGYMYINRLIGPYAWSFYALLLTNIAIPQALWFQRVRSSPVALFLISIVISIGMWLERFVIVVVSLHRDFIPAAWDMYYPTFWDWATYIGTIGFFLALIFLFIRVLPMISIFEMRELVAKHEEREERRRHREPTTGEGGEHQVPQKRPA